MLPYHSSYLFYYNIATCVVRLQAVSPIYMFFFDNPSFCHFFRGCILVTHWLSTSNDSVRSQCLGGTYHIPNTEVSHNVVRQNLKQVVSYYLPVNLSCIHIIK